METFTFDDLDRPDEVSIERPPWMRNHEFIMVESIQQLKGLIDQAIAAGVTAVDTETEGLDLRVYDNEPNHKLVGFSFCFDPKQGYYVPLGHYEPYDEYNLPKKEALAELERLIANCETWWFNAGFDHEVLFLAGLDNTPFLSPFRPGSKDIAWEDWAEAYNFIWSQMKNNTLKQASIHLLDPKVGVEEVERWLKILNVEGGPSAEELLKWTSGLYGHPYKRLSMAMLTRRWKGIASSLRPKAVKQLFNTITWRMLELDDIFQPEDFMRSGGQKNFAWLNPFGISTEYAASDAIVTLKVGHFLKQNEFANSVLTHGAAGGFTYRLEKQIIPAMRQMKRHRILIDRPLLTEYRDTGRKATDDLALEIQHDMVNALKLKGAHKRAEALSRQSLEEFVGFLHTPEEMSDLIFREIGVPSEGLAKTAKKGTVSTKADQFDILSQKHGEQYPFVTKISNWRSFDKLVTNPLDYLTDGGGTWGDLCGVHPEDDEASFGLKQNGAPTGRMAGGGRRSNTPMQGGTGINVLAVPSGKNPNNPPWINNIRDGFKARPGYAWVSIDFSGQELRIAANLTLEDAWVEEFVNGTGDMHSVVARKVYNIPDGEPVPKAKRSKAKNFNFASLYGGGVDSYIRTIGAGSMSKEEAQRQLNQYYVRNPKTKEFHERQFVTARKYGHIWTPFWRRCPVPDAAIDIDEETGHLSVFERKSLTKKLNRRIRGSKRDAINYVIQGCGADILKLAILFVWKRCRDKGWISDGRDWRNDAVKMLLPVHDELNFEVRFDILNEAIDFIVESMLHFQGFKKSWPVKFEVDTTVGPNWKRQVSWKHIKKGSSGVTPKENFQGALWPDGTAMIDDKEAPVPERWAPFVMQCHRLYLEQTGQASELIQEVQLADSEEEPAEERVDTELIPEKEGSWASSPVIEGVVCSVCGELQRATSSGEVCVNGHGGALGVPPEEFHSEPDSKPDGVQDPDGVKISSHIYHMSRTWLHQLRDHLHANEDESYRLVWVIRDVDMRDRPIFVSQQIKMAKIIAPGDVELDLRSEDGENLLKGVRVDPLQFIMFMRNSGL